MVRGQRYVAQRGESLYTIARRLGLNLAVLAAVNPEIKGKFADVGGKSINLPLVLEPRCPNGFLYTVMPGDTLCVLAQRFGTTVAAIQAANPGVAGNLQRGQVICIPAQDRKPLADSAGFYYAVAPGDTLAKLAQRFATTVAQLEQANPTINPQALQVDQVVWVPGATPVVCPGGFLYTVQQGDTYCRLAERFATTAQTMELANPRLDPDNLQLGQLICIPVAPR